MELFNIESLTKCVESLNQLTKCPQRFLDKGDPQYQLLNQIRAQSNRLIEQIKGEVRTRRGQPRQGKTSKPLEKPTSQTPSTNPKPPTSSRGRSLSLASCYLCNANDVEAHLENPALCVPCGNWNKQKRNQVLPLAGYTALITGGRVNIGFATALKLLRSQARVHITTRFPLNAAQAFEQIHDFEQWKQLLTIHKLNLLDPNQTLKFTDSLLSQGSLEILINNAAQTVRQPADFYRPLLKTEKLGQGKISSNARQLLAPSSIETREILSLTQTNPIHFPMNNATSNNISNSWTQSIDEVPLGEVLETQVINSFGPYLLIQQLLPSLRQSTKPRRFIINVSAWEGRFSTKKHARHPHTNMAKAALNMLTRTISADLAKEGILVNSVDPGWVTFQQPTEARAGLPPAPPLTADDAAARIIDPIAQGFELENPPTGKLWKNFQPVEW